MDIFRNPTKYRKAYIAIVAAVVSVATAANLPLAADFSQTAIAVFDSVAAVLVLVVPNAQS